MAEQQLLNPLGVPTCQWILSAHPSNCVGARDAEDS